MSPEIMQQAPSKTSLDTVSQMVLKAPTDHKLVGHGGTHITWLRTAALLLVTAAVLLTVYLLRLDPVVGQFKDDGWYVVLAKSLATGHGYNLINLPQHTGLYFYPPFFPFLLSLLYRILPEFPRNVALLKSLSAFAMLLLPILVYRLLTAENRLPRHLAYLVALTSSLAPPLVMLATSSLMSECVFTLLQFGALLFADRAWREGRDRIGKPVLLSALFCCVAYLTRSIGIAVVIAIVLSFVLRRMFRSAAIVFSAFVFVAGIWSLYTHSRAHETAGTPGGYSSQFWDRLAGSPGSKVTVRDLPARVWQLTTVMIGDDVGALIVPSFYRFGPESGEELLDMTAVVPAVSSNTMHTPASMGLAVADQWISLGFSIVVLIGFVVAAKRSVGPIEFAFLFSLMIIAVWPWSPIRLMAPLLPLILYYLLVGIARLENLVRSADLGSVKHWRAARMVIACVLVFFLYDHIWYISSKHKDPNSPGYPPWVRSFDDIQMAATWIREHTGENEVIVSDDAPLLYLYTNRATSQCSYNECAKEGIRYLVDISGGEVPGSAPTVYKVSHYVRVFDIRGRRQSEESESSTALPARESRSESTQ